MADQVITAQPGQTIQIAAAQGASPSAQAEPAIPAMPVQAGTEPPPLPPEVMVTERFFSSLDGVVVGVVFALAMVLLARLIQTLMIHLALRKAISANHAVADQLVERINRPFERAGPPEMPGDDRNGLVLIAIGAAIACAGLTIGGNQFIRMAFGASFFPLFVGLALLIRRRLVMHAIKQEEAAD